MNKPVRLMPAAAAAPRPLMEVLTRFDAVEPPPWLDAKPQPLRALLAGAGPAPGAAAVAGPGLSRTSLLPQAATPAAPAVDPALIAQVVAQATADAMVKGEQAGIAQGQAKVDAIIQRYADGIARLAEAQAQRAADDAASAVSLALVVAQEILGREIALDRTFLVTMVTEALATVGGQAPVRLRLSPTDLAYLGEVRPEVLGPTVEVITDESLGIGGCVVESEQRVVDASMETRLASVGAVLRQALAGTVDEGGTLERTI